MSMFNKIKYFYYTPIIRIQENFLHYIKKENIVSRVKIRNTDNNLNTQSKLSWQ